MKKFARIKFKTLLFSRFGVVISFVVLGIIIISFGRALWRDYGFKKDMKKLEQQIIDIGKKNKSATEYIAYLKSDEYVEAEARRNFGFVKPGENVVVVEGLKEKDVTEIPNPSNARKWIWYLLNRGQ